MKKFVQRSRLLMWFLRGIAKRLTAHRPKILMYHRFSKEPQERTISAQVFEQQIQYLATHRFNILTFSELHRTIEESGRAPKNCVVLTFDDGYQDFYEIALPILKKYGMSGTLFVSTGFIDGDYWMYQDKLRYLLDQCEQLPSDLLSPQGRALPDPISCSDFWHLSAEELLTANEQERGRYLQYLEEKLVLTLPDGIPMQYRPLTWEQLRECLAAGIEIGSHGVHHYSLANQPAHVVEYEVRESKRVIEEQLGDPVESFCYPFGMPADLNREVEELVERAGYSCGCVAYHHGKGRYRTGRLGIDNRFFLFLGKVSGLIY